MQLQTAGVGSLLMLSEGGIDNLLNVDLSDIESGDGDGASGSGAAEMLSSNADLGDLELPGTVAGEEDEAFVDASSGEIRHGDQQPLGNDSGSSANDDDNRSESRREHGDTSDTRDTAQIHVAIQPVSLQDETPDVSEICELFNATFALDSDDDDGDDGGSGSGTDSDGGVSGASGNPPSSDGDDGDEDGGSGSGSGSVVEGAKRKASESRSVRAARRDAAVKSPMRKSARGKKT